jgi:hypothetical protein|tara:strand:+ start:1622 stop:1813 length:192 start_codon:yes stop_codon:yes gene_type:complete
LLPSRGAKHGLATIASREYEYDDAVNVTVIANTSIATCQESKLDFFIVEIVKSWTTISTWVKS